MQTTHLIRTSYLKYVKSIPLSPRWSPHIPAALPAPRAHSSASREPWSGRKQPPCTAPTPPPAPIKLLSLVLLNLERATCHLLVPERACNLQVGSHQGVRTAQDPGWSQPHSRASLGGPAGAILT